MSDIFQYCSEEINNYQTMGVDVVEGYNWKMFDHVKLTTLYKNSQYKDGKYGDKPFKNIIRPILNVAYRSEGFDVKDIALYVEDKDYFYMSFLARKFHEKWALENNIDTFIDDVVETYCDYGGVLVKNVNNKKPEVVKWQQIAFVDQTDLLSGTIALKYQYSIDQLRSTAEELGWDKEAVDIAVRHAEQSKTTSQSFNNQSKTPSKYIEVFEVHGTFPETWLSKDTENAEDYNNNLDPDKYSKQIHIICYAYDENNFKTGVTLFKGKERESIFKFLARDPIYGRALGFGGIEELFEPQLWANFNTIHMTNMLKEASKVIHITTDDEFTTRNNTKNLKGGEFLTMNDGKTVTQLNTQPVNYTLFDRAVQEWEQHARTTGAASDPSLGLNPVSGTPLGTTQIVTSQGMGIHEYRRGKIATFISEIYRDWVLAYLASDLNKGFEWVDELSIDEMQDISERVMNNQFNDYIKKTILSGQIITNEDLIPLKEKFKEEFMKSSHKFISIAKDEFKKLPLKVKINVAGKQKDLGRMADKLSNVFRAVFANPQGFMSTMQIPGAAKAFNEMLEASGLSQFDFSRMPEPPPQNQQPIEPQLARATTPSNQLLNNQQPVQ